MDIMISIVGSFEALLTIYKILSTIFQSLFKDPFQGFRYFGYLCTTSLNLPVDSSSPMAARERLPGLSSS